jgi:hypothetical protein
MGEVVKLDTQGAELDILHGAARTLAERTICLITEVHFFKLYDGAPFFADIDGHLRAAGFTLIGFSDFQFRSSKRLDKRTHWSRERVFQADAIYFRDPLTATAPALRSVDVAVMMAVLLGFFDLALEWLTIASQCGLEIAALVSAIESLSAVDTRETEPQVLKLAQNVRRNPQLTHALIGKFVDTWRDMPTFHDISVEGSSERSAPRRSATTSSRQTTLPGSCSPQP